MLLGNYSVLHKSMARFSGGTTLSGDRANWNKPGVMRNASLQANQLGFSRFAAIPNGYLAPYCWLLPTTQGGMAVYRNVVGAGAVTAGNLAGGLNGAAALSGTGEITLANLALVVSAVAALTGHTALSVSLNATLQASAVLAGTGDLIGALQGIASVVAAVTGNGNAAGTASAHASMAASIVVAGELLTTANVAGAVWDALAASYNTSGTLGQKLNSAASGGVDYSAMADAVRVELNAELVRVIELGKLHGLDISAPLTVTAVSRDAGDVHQSIADASGTVTVTRT